MMTTSPSPANIIYPGPGPVPADDQPMLVLTTVADAETGKRIAATLVEEGLAACVNLGAESLSMYMWEGVLEGATEVSLTIKTRASCAQAVANRLGQLHPYDVPEILVLDLLGGSRAYLQWLTDQTDAVQPDQAE